MLEFLISAIIAAETHDKIKRNNERARNEADLREQNKRSLEISRQFREEYSDPVIETSGELISDKELMKIFQSLPSYDKKEEWTILNGSALALKQFRLRFTMAKFGKIPMAEARILAWFDVYAKKGEWYGDRVFDYAGQMQHELFLEWERQLHEKGFPYQLMVDNCFEREDTRYGFFVPLFSEGIPAKNYKYRYNNHYFWNVGL